VYVEGEEAWGSEVEVGLLILANHPPGNQSRYSLIPPFLLTFLGPKIHSEAFPFLPSPFI
jgi:hypothetical protein